jgi:hypothetical protein
MLIAAGFEISSAEFDDAVYGVFDRRGETLAMSVLATSRRKVFMTA